MKRTRGKQQCARGQYLSFVATALASLGPPPSQIHREGPRGLAPYRIHAAMRGSIRNHDIEIRFADTGQIRFVGVRLRIPRATAGMTDINDLDWLGRNRRMSRTPEAAIDHQLLAGDEARLRRTQEEYGFGNVFRLTHAANRAHRIQVCLHGRVLE